jgi:hypothetical protein
MVWGGTDPRRRRSRCLFAGSLTVAALTVVWAVAAPLATLGFGARSETLRTASYLFVLEFHRALPFGRSALLRGLAGPDASMRQITAYAIAEAKVPSAGTALADAFEAESDWEPRVAEAEALVALRQSSVVPRLASIAATPAQSGERWAPPRLARWALAEITRDPGLQAFRSKRQCPGKARVVEDMPDAAQVRLIRRWREAHRGEY